MPVSFPQEKPVSRRTPNEASRTGFIFDLFTGLSVRIESFVYRLMQLCLTVVEKCREKYVQIVVTRVTYTRNPIDIVENCMKVPVECRSIPSIGPCLPIGMWFDEATDQPVWPAKT